MYTCIAVEREMEGGREEGEPGDYYDDSVSEECLQCWQRLLGCHASGCAVLSPLVLHGMCLTH